MPYLHLWRLFPRGFLLLLTILPAPARADLYETTSYEVRYGAYNPTGTEAWTFKMKVYAPKAAGTYPIAIVLGGAGTCEDPPTCSAGYGAFATTVAEDAAKRGLIAAAVHYDSRIAHFCGCTGSETWRAGVAKTDDPLDCTPPHDGWDDKARAIFDNGKSGSALRRIIAASAAKDAKASLVKGIVVIGHSQGSWIAHMANGFTTRNSGKAVAGALLTGTGNWGYHGRVNPWPYPVRCNLYNASGVVAANNVRAFTAARDIILGVNENPLSQTPSPSAYPAKGTVLGARRAMYAVTGQCAANHAKIDKCMPSSVEGAGWRVVTDSHLTEGYGGADHAFMTSTSSSTQGKIDPKWRNGWDGEPNDPPISLKQNLNWLATKLGPDAAVLLAP